MATKEQTAQLSLYVYNIQRNANRDNRPNLPTAWERLKYQPDDLIGFSYGVFKNTSTGEVVVAYTGTNEKQAVDFLLANIPAGFGLSSLQVNAAARVAAEAIAVYGASNVSFTGHSLGGGLASVVAVWFDRPAITFDAAPFEATARNPLAVIGTRSWISANSGLSNPALNSFEPAGNFAAREAGVTGYYAVGEVLQPLRAIGATVVGTEVGVTFGNQNMTGVSGAIGMHSQALLTAGLMSDNFRAATVAVQRSVPLILADTFYAYDAATSRDRNFLIDLIRSEQQSPNNSKLDNFAADLQKLGTNIAGLNKAAQEALIAQGIEWYYWQGTDYAGQQFFTQTGELLQYTLAKAESKADGTALTAQNKAASYAANWLTPIANAHDEFYFPAFGTAYDQWNVAAGSSGVTATARDAAKRQIYIGGGGADTFTGGNIADVIFAGAGNDTLNGGLGNDKLYGGAGFDTYTFTGNWGTDTILDAGGQGSIVVDGITLAGGKKIGGLTNTWVNKEQNFTFTLDGTGTSQILTITKQGSLNSIRVQGWQNNQLGLTMDDTVAPAPAIDRTYLGDQSVPLSTSGRYELPFLWASDGSLIGGVAEANFADVIYASSGNDKMFGFGGNDALGGGAGNDEIDGGDGDDMIAGGTGNDSIKGGAGYDYSEDRNHYQLRSCLRPSILVRTPIRYPKTVQTTSLELCALRRRAKSRIRNTSNSIAAYAREQGVVVIFDGEGAI